MADIRINSERTFNPLKKGVKKYYKTNPRYIYYLDEVGKKFPGGNKTKNLAFLLSNDFNIPSTLVCSFNAFETFIKSPEMIKNYLIEELEFYINNSTKYSVRSSANIEDDTDFSFAGQFETFLNVKRIENVLEKIESIWSSVSEEGPSVYGKNLINRHENLKMGIIIQEMISPKFSGVIFTKNPVNGLDEIIIESVSGLGDKLVQQGMNPERLVHKWGDWLEFPESVQNNKHIYEELVVQSKKIQNRFEKPVDLEWAYDGNQIYWLQLREITTLKQLSFFSNKISKEFLPGIIKPLIWSINIPVVNSSWKRIFQQLIGKPAENIKINQLSRSFYYRAYFNMNIIGDIFEVLGMPRNLLEVLAGLGGKGENKIKFKPSGKTLSYLPRMVFFGFRMLNFTKSVEKFLRTQKIKYREIGNVNFNNLSIEECFHDIDILFDLDKETSYFVIICQLLNSFYASSVKKRIKKEKIEYESLDFSEINKKLRYYNPTYTINKLHNDFIRLGGNEGNTEEFLENYADKKFKQDFKRFMHIFGYLRDNGNDFSQPSWSETPEIVMKIIGNHTNSNQEFKKGEKTKEILSAIFISAADKSRLKRSLLYLELRQEIIALYSYGYGLFRQFFLRISEILTKEGILNKIDDIFYLSYPEIKELRVNKTLKQKYREKIDSRITEIKKVKNISLPEIIYDGKLPDLILDSKPLLKLKGIPTSSGYYVGPVKVVTGLKDIDIIQEGDIIAIPYSDVSWTPLFAKVKGIISESGGILSHCSIVAREYKIPSIVSVEGATQLKNNTIVAINAYNGIITVLDEIPSNNQLD